MWTVETDEGGWLNVDGEVRPDPVPLTDDEVYRAVVASRCEFSRARVRRWKEGELCTI